MRTVLIAIEALIEVFLHVRILHEFVLEAKFWLIT